MARKNNRLAIVEIDASQLHAADEIVCHDGSRLHLRKVFTRSGRIVVESSQRDSWTIEPTRKVRVMAELSCECSGTGRYRGAGYVENGVFKGVEGQHYACGGKGWQSRGDAIRNLTYWNKYARV